MIRHTRLAAILFVLAFSGNQVNAERLILASASYGKNIVAICDVDDALLDAFGFPKPSQFMRGMVARTLQMRGWLAGLLPSRKKPRLRTEMGHPSYPQGYAIEELGPKG